ncbi:hypothetical protein ACFRAE_00330 [Sphingobacterium sp. HJSM2_6]|uniref:hypothetical protein n=1 Tax=Sphingobacterium sp. HJSM2_6 TaxID=3366264 RepID=UPI003BBE6F10
MRKVINYCLLLGVSLTLTIQALAKSSIIQVDTSHQQLLENEAFFYRVASNQLLSSVYEDILGNQLGNTFQWLQIFAEDQLLNFSPNDYWILDNNPSGGFELYDEEFNYISVAPDLKGNFSFISSKGNWVKSRSNNFNKTYFSTDQGKEYTMTFKFSFGGKKVIKDEKGYEITLNSKLNGNTEIADNEGRKLLVKFDRSGVYRLLEGKKIKMSLMIQSLQHYRLSNESGELLNLVKRGRYNDIYMKLSNGQEILIENRFVKPIPIQVQEDKKEAEKKEVEKK